MSDDKDDDHEVIENPDPHFEPLVNLPPVQTKTLEEDEDELLKLRAKLFRYDALGEPREWKERGTGDVKILQHKLQKTCRILMRRDKTFKVCANHFVLPQLELKPSCGSDRAWVWSTLADFADEEPKPELLAIRFANADNAQKFKDVFEDAKKIMAEKLISEDVPEKSENKVIEELEKLRVSKSTTDNESSSKSTTDNESSSKSTTDNESSSKSATDNESSSKSTTDNESSSKSVDCSTAGDGCPAPNKSKPATPPVTPPTKNSEQVAT